MKKNNAMTQAIDAHRKLSNAQVLLLQLFERDLPEDDLKEVKNLLTRFWFKKAEQEAEKSMKIKGITNQQLNKEIDELNDGSRTEYLNKIRK
jgi:hypothetical protein